MQATPGPQRQNFLQSSYVKKTQATGVASTKTIGPNNSVSNIAPSTLITTHVIFRHKDVRSGSNSP